MQKRKFDELISHFNRKVSDMSINQKYKMELLGMISAIGFAHEKEHGTNLAEVGTDCISRRQAIEAFEDAEDAFGYLTKDWREVLEQLPPIHPVNNSEMPNSSDVISRQKAIDATKKHYRAHDNDLLELIAFDIEQLPPIQPDIVRCKDCKHWKDSDGVFRRGTGAESKCPLNLHQVYEGTFFCGLAERREVTT